MKRTARLSFDLDALSHNLQIVKQHAASSKVMAVIKANAYGHGDLQVAKTLAEADAFAVACVEEALYLHANGIEKEIVILQGFHNKAQLHTCATHGFIPVIHQPWQVELLLASSSHLVDVWLKVDTGMHRLGLSAEEFSQAFAALQAADYKGEVGVMSHLANADLPESEPNLQQIQLFSTFLQQQNLNSNKHAISLANSGAILTHSNSHYDWVRPGIMLYGVSPIEGKLANDFNLKPVMHLATDIIAIKQLHTGEPVGYSGNWIAECDTRVAVCAIGYADGYPRHAVNGTPVSINGQHFPLVGRVSMDMICVDIGDESNVHIGDEAVLWGAELPVEIIAQHADTIAYEILCHAGLSG